ncbi:hypothetical protein C0995_009205 [Termitomyces sp. Mi166|nr:hypothetical protein C0995_009205 [Termitomyces sp. Mi166\
MQAGPSNAVHLPAVPAPPAKKRRIPQAGIAIMEAWLNQHGSHPTKEDRNVMLSEIRHPSSNEQLIPGGESYDDKGVLKWFQRRRQLANSPYPTLSSKAIKHLTTLALANPFPLPGLIATWAELLHANTDDVTKWLAENRSPVRHLPTPVSTSPEPASEYQWALKADPISSPAIPSRNMPSFCSTHAREPHTLSDQQLIDAISEASRLKTTAATIPQTIEEFESMFEPYRVRMEDIIQQNEAFLQP